METTSPAWTRKTPAAPDQMRVDIQLTGEEGTKTESPFKVATYNAKADEFNSVRSVVIHTFTDGKATQAHFNTLSSDSKVEGEVKITSVTADTVSGEVNLTDVFPAISRADVANFMLKQLTDDTYLHKRQE